MRELIERLEKATGPDRELDIALLPLWDPNHAALIDYDDRYETEILEGVFSVQAKDGGYFASVPLPRFTASIDRAVALAERVHGWSWRVGNTPSGRGFAYLGTSLREHEAATPAIALCIAILRASQEGSEPS